MNGIIFLVFLFIVLPIIAIKQKAEEKRTQERLKYEEDCIREGKGAYFVKVASSGKGKVFHSPSCNKCRNESLITIQSAREQGYNPCSTCGGSGIYYDYDN